MNKTSKQTNHSNITFFNAKGVIAGHCLVYITS